MNATSVDEAVQPVGACLRAAQGGLPPLRPYFRALWQRRVFAAEMSRSGIRAANTNTFFGQVWLVLNPLLLAGVYYLLIDIIAVAVRRTIAARLRASVCGPVRLLLLPGAVTTGAGQCRRRRQAADEHVVPPDAAAACRRCGRRSSASCRRWSCTPRSTWSRGSRCSGDAARPGLPDPADDVRGRDGDDLRRAAGVLPRHAPASCRTSCGSGCTCHRCCGSPRSAPAKFKDFIQYNPLYSLLGGWTDLLVRAARCRT